MSSPTNPGYGPAVSEAVPWEVAYHLRLLYQAFDNAKKAIGKLAPGTTTENVTQINNQVGGSAGSPNMLAGLGAVNNQTGNTTYSTTNGDSGILLILDDASPVAVTLNAGVPTPWMIFATNEGAGTVTFTPSSGLINGGATFTLPTNYLILIVFDGVNWTATPDQFSFANISGQITAAQLPSAGISVTITTAALTTLGTQGSMTFVHGQLTASTPAT